MEVGEQENSLINNTTTVNPTSMMNSIGNQLRNMPIPSPPSLSSSCANDILLYSVMQKKSRIKMKLLFINRNKI